MKGSFRKIYTVSITDYTGSINLKIRAQEGEDCSKWESIPKGTTVVVRGDCSYDKYEHDYIVWPYDVLFVERKKREDNAPVKRVELHLHTKLSSMDAFCDPGGIVKLAHRMGTRPLPSPTTASVRLPRGYAGGGRHPQDRPGLQAHLRL